MRLSNLPKSLNVLFSTGAMKKRVHCNRMGELLEKLEDKKRVLESRVQVEEDPLRKKRLTTELKILNLQLNKGRQRCEELMH